MQLAKVPHTITELPPRFTGGMIQGLLLFHQLFVAHRPSSLTQRFRTFIRQFHCYIVQSLYSLTHWSLLTLLCFPRSDFLIAILLYRLALQYSPHNGFWHSFTILLLLCNDVLSSQPSVTQAGNSDEIIPSSFFVSFWSSSLTFGFFMSRFPMSPDSRSMLGTKEEKRLQKIFVYTKVKVNEEHFYLV